MVLGQNSKRSSSNSWSPYRYSVHARRLAQIIEHLPHRCQAEFKLWYHQKKKNYLPISFVTSLYSQKNVSGKKNLTFLKHSFSLTIVLNRKDITSFLFLHTAWQNFHREETGNSQNEQQINNEKKTDYKQNGKM
jgi:hypothetical protein